LHRYTDNGDEGLPYTEIVIYTILTYGYTYWFASVELRCGRYIAVAMQLRNQACGQKIIEAAVVLTDLFKKGSAKISFTDVKSITIAKN
jgi:hypothetical protein